MVILMQTEVIVAEGPVLEIEMGIEMTIPIDHIIPRGYEVAVVLLIIVALLVRQVAAVQHHLIPIAEVNSVILVAVESDRPEDPHEAEVIVQMETIMVHGINTLDIIIKYTVVTPYILKGTLYFSPSSSRYFLLPFYLFSPLPTKQKYQTVSRIHLILPPPAV